MRQHVSQRQQRLLAIVNARGSVGVGELAKDLDVHVVTVRRDIDSLVGKGLLGRRHGAAVSVNATSVEQQHPVNAVTVDMVAPVRDYYFGEIIRGAQSLTQERGGRLVLGLSGYEVPSELAHVSRLIGSGSEGILFSPTLDPYEEFSEEWGQVLSADVPIVLVERRFPAGHPLSMFDSIAADHAAGMALAVRHLADLGRTRISFLAHSTKATSSHLAGYRDALAQLRLSEPHGPFQISSEPEVFEATTRALLAEIRDKGIDGLIVHNDQNAMEVQRFLIGAGVAIPSEVAIVAYDDEVAQFADIPLTAVAPPKEEIGRTAAARLFERVAERRQRLLAEERALAVSHTLLVPRLIARQSTIGPDGSPPHDG